MEVRITTMPTEAETFEARTVVLGGGVSGKVTYIIEMESNPEDEDEPLMTFTLSNTPGVETEAEAIAQHIEMIAGALEVLQEAAQSV